MKALTEREKRRISLDVINPPAKGNPKISLYHAERYVRRGRARIVDGGLLFVFDTPLCPSLISEELRLLQQTAASYDRIDRAMTLREIRRIPIVCAARAFIK